MTKPKCFLSFFFKILGEWDCATFCLGTRMNLETEIMISVTDSPTALFGGYGVAVNASVPKAVVRLPFPQSATWYLTLQLTCNR